MVVGLFGNKYLAANTVILFLSLMIWIIPYSNCFGIWALVGNSLGENNPKKTKKIIFIGFIINFT